jgi:hypothetical protein
MGETDVGIYPHHMNRRRKTHVWRMITKTLLRSVECKDINPLYKLRPIDRNPVSNSIFWNSTGVFNLRNSWIG